MRVSAIAFTALLIAGCAPAAVSAAEAPPAITLDGCLVSLIEEAQVPAQQAGVLQEVAVEEGQQVKAGELLAKIDDIRAKMAFRVAGLEYEVAQEEAANDVHVRYATAAARVTEAEYLMNMEANRKVPGSVAQIEIQKLLLTHRRTVLEIEQARMNLRIAALKAKVSYAKVESAEENLQRHQITAPLDAEVVTLYRHAGEWVEPGDPVMHLVRMNRLRIEGFLDAAQTAPGEVAGQPVAVSVPLARGSVAKFTGKVVFVSPLVQAGGAYKVWAAVENQPEPRTGLWLLRPGLSAKMTIQLK